MLHTPALTIAIALAAGVLVQAVAFHLRMPGIVLLLGTGFLLGPEFANLVRPETLGSALLTLVGFAVAVILFEGGMNLNLARLRRQQVLIRRLVTWGALVTALGGALAAFVFLRWEPATALLFGTLVIVTGPTVVTPLLRRINVQPQLHTVLVAEGIIIDAVGALIAVVTLEIVLDPTGRAFAVGLASLPLRLGVGLVVGLAGGFVIALLLRVDRIVPEQMGNVFSLALAIALYQISNTLMPESGLVAAIVAGIVVGNARARKVRELLEFKEQLTTLFIGMLFVLLSANLRLADLRELGWGGVGVVATLMLVVRPLQIWLCARGAGLDWRQQAFLAWLAPRGIVAAAVSALFAQTLDAAGMPGGAGLRAMVFLVIVSTVVVQGLPAGLVARLLRVRDTSGPVCILVGANALGRLLGRLLGESGVRVTLVDADPQSCRAAEQSGLVVVEGNAIEEQTLRKAGADSAKQLIACTSNEGINLVSARRAVGDFRVRRAHVAIDLGRAGISPDAVVESGGRVLFGGACDLRAWLDLAEHERLLVERWRRKDRKAARGAQEIRGKSESEGRPLALPLLVGRARRRFTVDERWQPRADDRLWVAIATEHEADARAHLDRCGWVRDESPPEPAAAQK